MSPSSSTRLDSASSTRGGWPARTTFSTLEHVADTEHVAQFFESDAFLVACVSRFLREPLRRGGGAVVIATPEHLAGLERALDLEELSVEAAGRRGQYVCLDAEETLHALRVDGVPDPKRFRKLLKPHLAALTSRWSRVRVFDQMADLLWKRVSPEGARVLQDQWRALARSHRFALLSAYCVAELENDRSRAALVRMCSARGRILPPQRSDRVDWDRLLRRRWSVNPDERRGGKYGVKRAREVEAAVSAGFAAGPDGSGAKRRVLIVDDNAAVVETLGTALTILGNDVRSAVDGLDALEVGSSFHPDVILMDIGMPKMNGYDAARRIRQLPWGEDVTLVAITGWGQPEHRRRSDEAGFDEHLVKPVALAQLRRLLEEPVVHE